MINFHVYSISTYMQLPRIFNFHVYATSTYIQLPRVCNFHVYSTSFSHSSSVYATSFSHSHFLFTLIPRHIPRARANTSEYRFAFVNFTCAQDCIDFRTVWEAKKEKEGLARERLEKVKKVAGTLEDGKDDNNDKNDSNDSNDNSKSGCELAIEHGCQGENNGSTAQGENTNASAQGDNTKGGNITNNANNNSPNDASGSNTTNNENNGSDASDANNANNPYPRRWSYVAYAKVDQGLLRNFHTLLNVRASCGRRT
jgi:hypothetical protein